MSVESLYYLDLSFSLKFTGLTDSQRAELTSPAFRGALGTRLRRMCCTANLPECQPCPLNQHCPFPAFFAPAAAALRPERLGGATSVPRPFFLRAPGVADNLDGELRLTLVGTSAGQLPLVVAAVTDMGWGCTSQNITYEVRGLRALTGSGWITIGGGQTRQPDPFMRFRDVMRSCPGHPVSRAVVSLVTPLQLGTSEGKILPRVSAQAFLQRLVERVEALSVLYCGAEPERRPWAREAASTVEVTRDNTQMVHASTRSRRQDQDISVSGLVGDFELSGDLSLFAPYLGCLPAIGVGKKTTRGCGECEIAIY